MIRMSFAYREYSSENGSEVLYKRIRLYVQFIYNNRKEASDLEKTAENITGVNTSKANPLTGSLLIIYDDTITNVTLIKRQLYRYVSKRIFTGKITNFEDIKTFSHNKSAILKDIEERGENKLPDENNQNTPESNAANNFHTYKIRELAKSLGTNTMTGLTDKQAEDKVTELGLNVISEVKRKSLLKKLMENLNEFTTRLLIGVGLLSSALGHPVDGMAILGIALVEAVLSTLQQHRAEKSLYSLKKMMIPNATVIRNGSQQIIDAKYLVPGDIIILEAGEKIPADARLTECYGLTTSEAMLTGESAPVCKNLNICSTQTELADRSNMIYMGTNVLSGRGKAIVVATGRNTEIGNIAYMLQTIKNECAPIQNKIKKFTTRIAKFSIGLCLSLSAMGLFRGASLVSVIILGISFAIGAIPESLPAVVTAAMALSVQKMASKNAIVRKLPAVETLGSANVICCDKTGTLTMNEMTVKEIFVDNNTYKLTGTGYNPKGKILLKSGDPNKTDALNTILTAGILCNNSTISECEGRWSVLGDPTEGALITAARKSKLPCGDIPDKYKRIKEIPFDSSRSFMTVLVSNEDNRYAYCKGSLTKIMDKCTSIYDNGKERLFTSTDKEKLQAAADRMGSKALRVLAFCYKKVPNASSNINNNFVFLGLAGMEDPPRGEVKECIKKCRKAGIKVVMITGDNKNTAAAIGKNIGLLTDGIVLTGPELDVMSEDELYHIINNVQIFARTSPEQKYKIIKAFKRAGNIVAMTGDGVNDAPAMKAADIGIAMGVNGSDVARDSADIILTDDNFAAIVSAIEEGRTVNRNIKNSIKYLLSGCLSEMIAIGIATMFTGISPFISMQILWVNVIAETILGSSLTLETPSDNTMNCPPCSREDAIVDNAFKKQIVKRGLVIGLTTYAVFQGSMLFGTGLKKARTLAFTNIILSQIINVYDCRANKKKRNKYMNIASAVCLIILGIILYTPVIGVYFSATPLLSKDILLLAATTALAAI